MKFIKNIGSSKTKYKDVVNSYYFVCSMIVLVNIALNTPIVNKGGCAF